MMQGSSQVGRMGLLFGVLVWVASSSGWAALAPKKAPDEAKLREAETLKEEYERLHGEGKYPEAAEVAERACSILEAEHGKSSIELAGCLNDLGVFVGSQGDYGEAELLHKRALAIFENVLGPEHPDVAASLNKLATVYDKRGRYSAAESLYEQALAIRKKVLGVGHPDVAASLSGLAGLYEGRGEFREGGSTVRASTRHPGEGAGLWPSRHCHESQRLRLALL